MSSTDLPADQEPARPYAKAAGEPLEIHGHRAEADLLPLDFAAYLEDFNRRVMRSYGEGRGHAELPADVGLARSLIPPGTAALRDFSYVAPEIPELIAGACVGCMDCVTQCPDTAILAKVSEPEVLETALARSVPQDEREWIAGQWTKTQKFYEAPHKRGETPGLFGLFVDPAKCKGCGECVTACGEHRALRMVRKHDETIPRYRRAFDFFRGLPPTPPHFIREKVLVDMMLASERSLLYVGGAGSCAGCGEGTAIRMMLAAGGFAYGRENLGIVAATGCNTVIGSTYPYNPFLVPWTNSLFENAPAVAMGIRLRWNQVGWQEKRLWVIGGDGALYDIGFQSLSRLLTSGLDVKVLVLDTQLYSNTGGQTSTASFSSQGSRMSPTGKAAAGKSEGRKELAQIAIMHPEVFVAQTTCAHPNHFYRAVLAANSYPGPAVVNVYTTCQPEHGVADDRAAIEAKLAVDGRAFPLLVHDPRLGARLRERLSLQGNPNPSGDWALDPKSGEPFTFVDFARGQGRFARAFDAAGQPTEALRAATAERLASWQRLQELAGLR
jgi:pyruvate/2-oxoacid:ferredoxin oxidoreductase beta subunit/Fe-S-cluster-containing hydrogenase component 2